jgi:Flp pilus assembly protein TadD
MRRLAAPLALCALTVLAFTNSFQSGFILDNRGLLLDPRIREATSENIALIFRHTYWWPTGEAGLYRPFTTLTYLFNYAVLGDRDQPAGYHAINLILHLGNVLLAYALARRLIREFWPSFFVAALWSVHPALTESVTNIVGRADLLAGMAVVSGFLMYLKSAESAGRARAAWLAGLAIVTAAGVFSKESAVAIFPLIVLYELVWWKDRPQRRAFIFGCVATLLPIAAMLYQRSVVLAASAPAEFPFTDNPIAGTDWWTGRLTAIKVMADYLRLTIWPAKLSCDYSYNQIPLAHGSAANWLAFAGLLAMAAITILLFRWNRACFFLACFALLNFAPASNLLFSIGTIMAGRLLYLPALGLLGCLVAAIFDAARGVSRPGLAPIILSLITAGFAARTWIRNLDWQSELAIATADVRVSPNSFKLRRLLAASLFDSDPSHSNIDEVIAEQQKSVALVDPLPPALSRPEVYRIAGYYDLVKSRRQGQVKNPEVYRHAIQALRRSILVDEAGKYRSDPQAYFLLSVAYLESGDPDKALAPASQALALDPLNPQVYRQFSAVFVAQGRRGEAELAAAMEDAITAVQERKWKEAADLSLRVLASGSDTYPAAFYLNAIANLHIGKLDLAENSAREAIRLDRAQRNPRVGYVLGLILAQKKEFRQCAELLTAYLNIAPDAPDASAVRSQLRDIERLAK